MTAGISDITIEQGATYRRVVTFGRNQVDSNGAPILDSQGKPVLDPYDLTGVKIRMQIRRSRQTEVLLEATTENGCIAITQPLAGVFVIEFTATQTDTLQLRRAKYDVELEYLASGDVIRLLQGNVTISPNITRAVP